MTVDCTCKIPEDAQGLVRAMLATFEEAQQEEVDLKIEARRLTEEEYEEEASHPDQVTFDEGDPLVLDAKCPIHGKLFTMMQAAAKRADGDLDA